MYLDHIEADLVKETWRQIKNVGLQDIGIAILHRLFADQPQTIPLFYDVIGDGVKITKETVRNNVKVSRHAHRLASSLDKIVEEIEEESELQKILRRLGKSHKLRKVDSSNFELLGPVLLAVIADALGEDATDEVISAWAKAYDVIKEGITANL